MARGNEHHESSGHVDHVPVVSIGRDGAPLALWLPPLGMTKEDMRPVLELLAGAGFRAVSLDPWQHGERGSESADEIRVRVFSDFRRHMWPIIGQTALDCLRVIDHFGGTSVVAGGASMGGDAAVTLAGIDRRVSRVAAVASTPDWTRPGMRDIRDPSQLQAQGQADSYAQWFFERLDPITHVDNYAHGPAILFESGAEDMHVLPDGAQRFAAAVGRNVSVNVRAGFGHIEAASSLELIENCVALLRG
jgi:pimeloyl-ACP methyl ester carboxylesterase